jgi:hypothetical protein
MKNLSRIIIALGFIVASVIVVNAFSLLGPYKSWQVHAISYQLAGDIGGPMTLSEGYRWNTPTITYGFDSSFIDYFGPNGVAEVEKAIKLLQDLPPGSQIQDDGQNIYVNGQPVPFDTKFSNEDAAQAGLLDLKSHALTVLLEELGLATPERFIFTLKDRNTFTAGGVTFTNYLTIMANYDPITFRPSAVVNLLPYGYEIVDPIRAPGGDYASAVEVPPDLATYGILAYTSVASGSGINDVENGQNTGGGGLAPSIFSGLRVGEFYAGLTFDDVGALRFLYRTNNMKVENLLPNTFGGNPASGSGTNVSPWFPFLGTSNFFFVGTNFFFNTNVFGTNATNNLIVQGLRPGVNKLNFRRVNYDSILGQLFVPFTNRFLDTVISNSRPIIQPVQRAITRPDILFSAGDLGVIGNPAQPVLIRRSNTDNWENNDLINGGVPLPDTGGPGVIRPPVNIIFGDQLPYFIDITPGFFTFGGGLVFWGSFDGSTNEPVVYPFYGGFTIQDLRGLAVGSVGN